MSTTQSDVRRDSDPTIGKVLFLDVDGVLNNQRWAIKMFEEDGLRVYRDNILYEPSLRQLKRIINITGALIVVSSAWRQIPSCYADLKAWLERFEMEIYDKTPYVGGERGDDITAWFERNPGEWRYAILDDDSDMGIHMDHLVKTRFDRGLTWVEADKCIELLEQDFKRGDNA